MELDWILEIFNLDIYKWIKRLGITGGIFSKEEWTAVGILIWSIWKLINNLVFREGNFNIN